jgi:hypothetical protein
MNPTATEPTTPRQDESLAPEIQPGRAGDAPQWVLAPEDLPNIDDLVIEDGKPVDSIFMEKQQRLLTEPLYCSWPGPEDGRPFLALANVGLFSVVGEPPLVPDVMLSLDVKAGDQARKENRSYILWVIGKPPDAVIEVVSDRRGGEAVHKMRDYARVRVLYYVIFDPRELLGGGVLRVFRLRDGTYEPMAPGWFNGVGLGLTLWQGAYEGLEANWLRWCDRQGQLIPTGRERAEQETQRAEQETQRAEQEKQRADRLEAKLRALGIDPST